MDEGCGPSFGRPKQMLYGTRATKSFITKCSQSQSADRSQ